MIGRMLWLKKLQHNLKSIPSHKWVVALFLSVLALTSVQIIRESYGVFDVVGQFLSGGEVSNPTGPNQVADGEKFDAEQKTLFVTDNYHRCQNKFGMVSEFSFGHGGELDVDALSFELGRISAIGGRHVVFNVVDLSSSGGQVAENLRLALRTAREQFVVPIINVISVVPEDPTRIMTELYQNIAEPGGDPFIATTLPDEKMREVISSGYNVPLMEETIIYSNTVAGGIQDFNNILVATPIFRVADEVDGDGFFQYRGTDKDVPRTIRFNNNAVGPQVGENNYLYDITLVDAPNSDVTFKDLREDSTSGKSRYERTGHFLYSSPETSAGDQRFPIKRFLYDKNRFPQTVVTKSDGDVFNTWPQTQAIIMNFRDVKTPEDIPLSTTLERMESDFARFSDDPSVRAVIFSSNVNTAFGQLDDAGVNRFVQRITKAGTNCNYDIQENIYEYPENSAALSCSTTANTGGPGDVTTRVVCKPEPLLGPDYYACGAKFRHTMQIGLPIRFCGSNNPWGIDTKAYPTYAGRANALLYSQYYDAFQQFAGTLNVQFDNGGTPSTTSVPIQNTPGQLPVSLSGDYDGTGDNAAQASVVVIGDSQSTTSSQIPGRGTYLPAQDYGQVQNFAIGGTFSNDFLRGIHRDQLNAAVSTGADYAVIMFGTNDCADVQYGGPGAYREVVMNGNSGGGPQLPPDEALAAVVASIEGVAQSFANAGITPIVSTAPGQRSDGVCPQSGSEAYSMSSVNSAIKAMVAKHSSWILRDFDQSDYTICDDRGHVCDYSDVNADTRAIIDSAGAWNPSSGSSSGTSNSTLGSSGLATSATRLASKDQVYEAPWLGNCINNAAEFLKFATYLRSPEPHPFATYSFSEAELERELKELEQDFYGAYSIYAFSDFEHDTEVDGEIADTLGNILQKQLEEKVTTLGTMYSFDSHYQSITEEYRSFDPTQVLRASKTVNQCGGQVQFVEENPHNLVYGAEMIIDEDYWAATGSEMCYWLASGQGDIRGQAQCENRATDLSIPCTCDDWNDEYILPTSGRKAGEVYDRVNGPRPALTLENVRSGLKCRAELVPKVNNCIQYVSGADAYVESEVFYDGEQLAPGAIEVDGIYEALSEAYLQLRESMSRRGVKVVFNEKRGWEGETIIRSYSEVPAKETDYRIQDARQLRLDDDSLSVSGQATGSNGSATPIGGSCPIGISARTVTADRISELGYGYAQTVIQPGDDMRYVAEINEMCEAGIVPTIRSCNLGQPCYSSGAEQARVLNSMTSQLTSCQEVFVTCGHNEPISEYNPSGGFVLDANEGRFTAECTANIDKVGGKVKVTTPIFNGTHPSKSSNVASFYNSFTASGGDVSIFDCFAANIYDEPGQAGQIEVYTEEMRQAKAAAGMEALQFCIMETGIVLGNPSGERVADSVVPWFNNNSDIMFALGFAWVDNPFWQDFNLDDGGEAIVSGICGEGRNSDRRSYNPFGSLVGTYAQDFRYHLAEGDSINEYSSFFEKLNYLDDIAAYLSILAPGQVLPSIEFDDELGYYVSGPLEHSLGLFTCDEWDNGHVVGDYDLGVLLTNLKSEYGEDYMPNCIAPDVPDPYSPLFVEDPLGSFLCLRGYSVGPECEIAEEPTLQCRYEVDNLTVGEFSSITNPNQLSSKLLDLTSRIESNMCIPQGLLTALLEREITGQLQSLDGDIYEQVYNNPEKNAWGPAAFTDIAWRTRTNPAIGKEGGAWFEGTTYNTKDCLEMLGFDYTNPEYQESPDGDNFVVNRSYLGAALCGAAAKLKNDSGTGDNQCSDWTKEEVELAAQKYLCPGTAEQCAQYNVFGCAQSGREYCGAFSETMCAIAPGDNPRLCGGSSLVCDSDGTAFQPIESVNTCAGDPLNDVPYEGSVIWPIEGASESSITPNGKFEDARVYACPTAGFHTGIDISYPLGTPVLAVADGYVVLAGLGQDINEASAPYGNIVKIQHGNNFYTLNAHLNSINVQQGQFVNQGEVIGTVGNTQYDRTGNFSHLHFEVRAGCTCSCDSQPGNCWLDPLSILGSDSYGGSSSSGADGFEIEDVEVGQCDDDVSGAPEVIRVPGYTVDTSYMQDLTARRRELTCEMNAGREFISPKGILLHWSGGEPYTQREGVLNYINQEEMTASDGSIYLHVGYQFEITVDGDIHQIAPFPNYFENHATGFSWRSIGIGLEGRSQDQFTSKQLAAAAALSKALMRKYSTIEYMVAHEQADNIAYTNQCPAEFKDLVAPNRRSGGIGCKGDVGTGNEVLTEIAEQVPGIKYCNTTTYGCAAN